MPPSSRRSSASASAWPWCASASARSFSANREVIDQTLITLLAGGHALLIGVPGLAKTRLVETLGIVLGLDVQAHPVHARPHARRHPGLRGAGGERDGPARLSLHRGAGLLPAPDGGRGQPREPAHPVGPAPGHAGGPRLGRRALSSAAAALPRARDAEPARAGGHLSAARGAARPLPHANRRRATPRSRPSGACSPPPPESPRRSPAR